MKKSYIIKSNPEIQKYVVFLCGSYYRDKDFDKRKILIKFINSISKDRIKPIIVDDFLSNDDIETSAFTIEQYEELIANVSFANFIYLESFSSASELGLFTHSSSSNKNYVFYPDNSNLILDKIGYFIKTGILKDPNRVISESYLALVERFAHGTDFIDEHYYFAKNELPMNIREITTEAVNEIINKKLYLAINETSDTPTSLDFFEIAINKNHSTIYLSSKTGFYLLYSILFSEESFEDVASLDINSKLDYYCESLKNTIVNTIYYYSCFNQDSVLSLKILNFTTVKDFVCCALFFIKYMSKESVLSKRIKRELLISPDDVMMRIDYFDKEKSIIEFPSKSSSIRKTKCIKRFTLYKKHKARNIIAYDDTNGYELRAFHEKMSEELIRICNQYNLYSNSSFAYKKGISTLKCVRKHSDSLYFLKLDIHHFFETMSFDILKEILLESFEKSVGFLMMSQDERKRFVTRLTDHLSTLTVNKRFPIGFVSSPIISEIYLSKFDSVIFEECKSHNIIYTRYADDLLFSSKNDFDFELIERLSKDELCSIGLHINDKKTQKRHLVKAGDSINYIGLNIVFDGVATSISVGKTYIKKLAKLKAYGHKSEYNIRKIEGLESYLKYNDELGFEKYQQLLKIYTKKKK